MLRAKSIFKKKVKKGCSNDDNPIQSMLTWLPCDLGYEIDITH
jgi:hypothetical protein